jgi:hypothetical protein
MNTQILSFIQSLVGTAFVFVSVIFLNVGLPEAAAGTGL